MASSTFTNLIAQIRNAIYGKDVRSAIADAIEICYDSSSGDVALDAADRANKAATSAQEVTQGVADTLDELNRGLADLDSIVEISEEQPTSAQNKIWIQPQDETEYKIPTFAAYEALWSRVQDFGNVYQQGHGGVVSIEENLRYSNPEDPLEREYTITYSDGTVNTIHMRNGERGATGPVDTIAGTAIWYCKGVVSNGALVQAPPESGWSNQIPTLNPGDYLWARTVVTYQSGAQAYIYALSRMGINGIDGSGAVNSVAIGTNGTAMAGDIKLPIDDTPTFNSGNLMTSGGIRTALSSLLQSPSLNGVPTAPTAATSVSNTQLATTAFVHNALDEQIMESKRISVVMSSSPYVYQSSTITENTYCIFNGEIATALSWATTDGSLTITADNLPSDGISFDVILVNTSIDE